MTVCLAAVCTIDEKEAFVLASDHMVDVGFGQFEHDIKKYKKINNKTIAMIAGNPLIFDELIDMTAENPDKKKLTKFDEIKEKIFENFQKVKKTHIANNILQAFDLTEQDIKEAVKSGDINPFMGKVIDSVAKAKLKTNILLIGFEGGHTKIAEVTENGFGDFGDIHTHAIGSGRMQAMNTLLFQQQSKDDDINTTIYNVYKAKRNAEVSVGVGKETDIMILTQSGTIKISDDKEKTLAKIYEQELKFGKTHEKVNEILQDIIK